MADVVVMVVVSLLMMPAVRRLIAGLIWPSPRQPGSPGNVPAQGIHMERDPVCGTFVVPTAAVTLGDGSRRLYFCSAACRDRYRARTA